MKPWSTIVIVYRHMALPRLARSMSDEEYRYTRTWLERVPLAVHEWSEGNAQLEPFHVVDVDRPVTHVTDIGNRTYWLAPEDCGGDLRSGYDCTIVAWPADVSLALAGWGCTIPGFSSCTSCFWEHFVEAVHPEEGFVHEWLHQVEAVFRERGLGEDVFPNLHDAGESRSSRDPDVAPFGRTFGEYQAQTGTWQPWYRDYMTGTLSKPGGGTFGLSAGIWASRDG
jgi:hypothetical protein